MLAMIWTVKRPRPKSHSGTRVIINGEATDCYEKSVKISISGFADDLLVELGLNVTARDDNQGWTGGYPAGDGCRQWRGSRTLDALTVTLAGETDC
jgi:hypothetical protein